MILGFNDGTNIFEEFIEYSNKNQLRVLEIGSRIVSPKSISKRALFPNAFYTGFDLLPDTNTDIVGDVHKLSTYFPDQKFDAIFSVAVLEHLACPWIVALEISKLLKIGGLTFHCVPQSWPLHEMPWDFWRFSEESLKILFSPVAGFEVMKTGYLEPLHMNFDNPTHPELYDEFSSQIGFGGVAIYARKSKEPEIGRLKWNVNIEEILGPDCFYPKKE